MLNKLFFSNNFRKVDVKRKNVLLLGSFGHTNLGDDALLFSVLNIIKDLSNIGKVYINCGRMTYRDGLDIGHKIIFFNTYRGSIIQKLKILRSCDLVILCGGNIIKELYRNMERNKYSVIFFIFLITFFARMMGKKVYAFNIGIGPINSRIGHVLANLSLFLMDQIILRDRKSSKYVSNIIKNQGKLSYGIDSSFIIRKVIQKPASTKAEMISLLNLNKVCKRKLVGVNLVYNIREDVSIEKFEKNYVDFINKLTNKHQDVIIVFFPFQSSYNPNNDLAFFKERIYRKVQDQGRIVILDDLSLSNVILYLEMMDAFIGMRYHSLVFSILAKVPFVALAYDEKCNNLIEQIQYPYYCDIREFDADHLLMVLDNIFDNSKEIVHYLNKVCEECEGRAVICRQLLVDILK